MSIQKYLEEMREIQSALRDFFEDEMNDEDIFQNLINLLKDVHEDKYKFKSFLYLFLKITNNFHCMGNLYNKIDRILRKFKEYIKQYFTNSEIFHIFKSSKIILLFLFEEKILFMDEYIAKQITKAKYLDMKYPQYFTPEIMPFINDYSIELPENFNEMRKKGENDRYICELIRKDSIDEFVIYINGNLYPITSTISSSIYETHSFLLKRQNTTLIEYALFFGSIQIFNYLRLNEVKLTESTWIYAIHGKNPEIIHILEENNVEPKDKYKKRNREKLNKFHDEIIIESIKCHHNNFTQYLQDKFDKNKFDHQYIYKYYNFALIKDENTSFSYEELFYYICKYDYYLLVNILIKLPDFNINKALI